jgi:hypothetical protein
MPRAQGKLRIYSPHTLAYKGVVFFFFIDGIFFKNEFLR